MNPVLNVCAYLFVPLHDRERLRPWLLHEARQRQLLGTILLAEEGINLFLAGAAHEVRGFLWALRADDRFAPLRAKESWSAQAPFRRLLIKLKREIIRMNHPAIRPAQGRAPSLSAPSLKRWLDQGHDDSGRPLVLLDTRNAFEVDCGSFAQAIDWRLRKFTEFPTAAQVHRAQLEGHTVVSFCTGGIRCEKAALYLREAGLSHVWQLEGGILQYFEEVGGAHYRGDCFVFDEREALTPDLSARRAPTHPD